jgi:hypothetical protein
VPAGTPLVAAEEVAIHQAADLECDWRDDNAAPACSTWGGVAQDLDELAARLAQQPAGQRALVWRAWGNETTLQQHPLDHTVPGATAQPAQPGAWWDAGADETATIAAAIYEGLASRGVTLDWVFADVEWNLSVWGVGTCTAADDATRAAEESRWAAIADDPRFPELRDRWVDELGADGTVPLQTQLCPIQYGVDRYLQWNALMTERTAAYYARALFAPARATFPAIAVSNYDYAHHDPAFAIPDFNGHATMKFGAGAVVGTHQSPPCYGSLGQVADRPHPLISATSTYARTAFNSFRYAVNEYRARALARPDVPMAPWVAPRNFADAGRVPHAQTALWDELVLHLGLGAPAALIYWNNASDVTALEDAALDAALRERNRLAGCGGAAPLQATLAAWDAPWVVSGVTVDDRRVWRFTPEDPAVTLVAGEDGLVAQAGARRLVFPAAWVVPGPATRGAWVVQAAGAAPPREE